MTILHALGRFEHHLRAEPTSKQPPASRSGRACPPACAARPQSSAISVASWVLVRALTAARRGSRESHSAAWRRPCALGSPSDLPTGSRHPSVPSILPARHDHLQGRIRSSIPTTPAARALPLERLLVVAVVM